VLSQGSGYNVIGYKAQGSDELILVAPPGDSEGSITQFGIILILFNRSIPFIGNLLNLSPCLYGKTL
jgi:hypothetical protein